MPNRERINDLLLPEITYQMLDSLSSLTGVYGKLNAKSLDQDSSLCCGPMLLATAASGGLYLLGVKGSVDSTPLWRAT